MVLTTNIGPHSKGLGGGGLGPVKTQSVSSADQAQQECQVVDASDNSRITRDSASPAVAGAFDEETAWRAILALRRRELAPPDCAEALHRVVAAGVLTADGRWSGVDRTSAAVSQLFELYLPLCAGSKAPLVIGHLGQSLDGRIATESGNSRFVNCAANLLHLHRLRALADAVLVGAGTVKCDDPQLTVRMCPGPSPLRVVIDTNLGLAADHRLFDDPAAPTLVVCAQDRLNGADHVGRAEVLGVPRQGDWLDAPALLQALAARGVRVLLVEGGGVTISRFLAADALDRLQLAVAPVIIGSGRPGIALPVIERMDQALRPPVRRYVMGDDILFDCALHAG